MSQQALYQVLGLYGYQVTNLERDEKQLFVHARPQPHRVCCSACGSREVIRRGESTRTIRNLPIGADCSWVVVTLPRVECRSMTNDVPAPRAYPCHQRSRPLPSRRPTRSEPNRPPGYHPKTHQRLADITRCSAELCSVRWRMNRPTEILAASADFRSARFILDQNLTSLKVSRPSCGNPLPSYSSPKTGVDFPVAVRRKRNLTDWRARLLEN